MTDPNWNSPSSYYASRFNRATMWTLLMDVHRHEINISVMHSNLNVGRAEEENNFLKKVSDVYGVIVSWREDKRNEGSKKKRNTL